MIKQFILATLVLASLSVNADERWRSTKTSVIEDSMCIPLLDGTGYLHVDEDVAGLIIQVVGADGTSVALYDTGTELEDIAAIGTYAAPSANNVRVSPDALTGGDCTQMMFADAVYSGEDWIQIRVTDGQTTIMDFTRWVYLNLMTSTDAGLVLGPLAITTVTSQTELVLPSGESNDDAYNNMTAIFTAGTEKCQARISDYTGSGNVLFLDATANTCTGVVTLAQTTDTVRIYAWAAPSALQTVDDELAVVDGNVDATLTDTSTTLDNKLVAIEADTSELQVDDYPALIAALPTAAEIWAVTCEDQGTPLTCREAMSILLAEAAGTCVYTSGTRTWVCKDPSGTETRLTIVYGAELDGDRTTSTPAPMTP